MDGGLLQPFVFAVHGLVQPLLLAMHTSPVGLIQPLVFAIAAALAAIEGLMQPLNWPSMHSMYSSANETIDAWWTA